MSAGSSSSESSSWTPCAPGAFVALGFVTPLAGGAPPSRSPSLPVTAVASDETASAPSAAFGGFVTSGGDGGGVAGTGGPGSSPAPCTSPAAAGGAPFAPAAADDAADDAAEFSADFSPTPAPASAPAPAASRASLAVYAIEIH